jgi:hypothetical protein
MLPLAHASIYTWTDESGRVNISNLAPPEGVKVTRVVEETIPKVVAPRVEPPSEALRDAEVRLLAERVRQLQDEVDNAKRPAPRDVEYRMIPAPPAPPVIQYIQAPPVQYAAPQPAYDTCGFGFDSLDCGFGWGSGFYPANFIVLNSGPFRRGFPGRGDNAIGPRPPMPMPIHGGGATAPWSPIVMHGGGRGH